MPAGSPAERHKRSVALFSVCAAVILTATKLGVGLWTNSLGLLSEAAHSGLDLVAAGMTLWAVSISGRPADERHAYGHGKIENLSALFETILLLGTSVWIVWQAMGRLFFKAAQVEVNVCSFLVITLSIMVNTVSSRALSRAAHQHQSQALEADALHFSTDVWSSWVVLAGLAGVLAARRFGWPFLAQADAFAALGVSGVVAWVCWKIGEKSINDLLDASPRELQETVAAAARVEGVTEVRQVRVRRSGPAVFADVVVAVGHAIGLERAHAAADRAEQSVRAALPGADVVVHVEPCADKDDPLTMARVLAERHGLGAHGLRIYEEDGRRYLELHLEVPADLRLDEAHDLAGRFESDLRQAVPQLADVVTHIEPVGERPCSPQSDPRSEASVLAALQGFLPSAGATAHDVKVRRVAGELAVSLHCVLERGMGVKQAHDLTVLLEKHLRAAVPDLGRVVVHVEPPEVE